MRRWITHSAVSAGMQNAATKIDVARGRENREKEKQPPTGHVEKDRRRVQRLLNFSTLVNLANFSLSLKKSVYYSSEAGEFLLFRALWKFRVSKP